MSNSANDFEYFEGVKVIQHEDGSHTYIQTTHEPYIEPLTKKEQWAVIGITGSMIAGIIALPFVMDRFAEWDSDRREIRRLKRQKKLKAKKAKLNSTEE